MIRLFLVDDHPIVSSGLAARYGALAGFEVAGTASSLQDALYAVARTTVDVALVDVQLDLLLTPRQVNALAAHCRVVLYTARSSEPYIRQLLDAGASAAVDKAAPLAELDAVVRDVHAGKAPVTTPVSGTSARDVLSAREYEVYRALASCQTPKEVAATLGVARSTVYCHIENVRRKLGVQTLQEIVARAAAETS